MSWDLRPHSLGREEEMAMSRQAQDALSGCQGWLCSTLASSGSQSARISNIESPRVHGAHIVVNFRELCTLQTAACRRPFVGLHYQVPERRKEYFSSHLNANCLFSSGPFSPFLSTLEHRQYAQGRTYRLRLGQAIGSITPSVMCVYTNTVF